MRNPTHLQAANGRSINNRRRRWLAWVFAVIFGAHNLPHVLEARSVPFALPATVGSGSAADNVQSLAAADVDGDGDIDLLATVFDDATVLWFENTASDGSAWTPHTISSGLAGPASIFAADIDNDGDIDAVVVYTGPDDLVWHENTASDGSTWQAQSISSFAGGAESVFAADVNLDGDIDVILPRPDFNKVTAWYRNNSGNSWSQSEIASLPGIDPRSVFAADLDSDGDVDVVAADDSNDDITMYVNNNGFWSPHILASAVADPESIFAADIDADGDIDMFVVASALDEVLWLEGTGGLTWVEHTIATSADGAESVFAADVDGDGDLDALVASPNDNSIAWLENDGSPTGWTEHLLPSPAGGAVDALAADMDSDGDLDVVGAAAGDNTVVLYDNELIHRSALFNEEQDVASGLDFPHALFAADIDGDGDLDAVVASRNGATLDWLENAGGFWSVHAISSGLGQVSSAFAVDVDSDGDVDVIAATALLDRVEWYENQGSGSAWSFHQISSNAEGASSVFAADIDQDGDVDVLAAGADDGNIRWFENGGGAWSEHQITSGLGGAAAVFAADVDGDGDLDAVVAVPDSDQLLWYEQDGGSWLFRSINTFAPGVRSVFAADVDLDGDTDVLAAHEDDDRLIVHLNSDGDGQSWISEVAGTPDDPTDAVAADLDADGDLDVLAAIGAENVYAWFENVGIGKSEFGGSSWIRHDLGSLPALSPQAVIAADFDGDGDLDALGAAGDGDEVAYFENQGGQFALPTTDVAANRVSDGALEALLAIDLEHLGRSGDSEVELSTLELAWTDGSGTPLDSAGANAIIDELFVYRDDGDDVFDPTLDTQVASVADLALTAGQEAVPLPDGDSDVATDAEQDARFFVVTRLTDDASAQTTDDLRVKHITSGSSTAEDASADLPLILEASADVETGTVEINDAPVGVEDTDSTVVEDQSLNAGSVLENDLDEEDDALTAVLISGPSNASDFNLASDGTFNYTPSEHFSGSDSFSYRADDGLDTSDPTQVSIEVTPVADPPELSTVQAGGDVDTAIPLAISAALVDLDGSESLAIEISGVPAGASLSAGTDQGGGVWALTAGDLAGLTITPPAGDDADFTLTVSATATESGNGDQAMVQATLFVEVWASGEVVFLDGFESGNTNAWSRTEP